MKTIFTFFTFALCAVGLNAQYGLPVTFETPMEDTAWVVFENAKTDPEPAENFVLVENPDKTGINTSDFCIKFIVVDGASPWAGAYSDAYGDMPIVEGHQIMEMMVLKDKISPCGLKIEGSGDPFELKVSNTKTGEWELISFDFTAAIGQTKPRLTFFPDFPDTRTSGGTSYIDNIGFVGGWTSVKEVSGMTLSVYPNPTVDVLTVKYPGIDRITISNLVGQPIRSIEYQQVSFSRVEVSDLTSGVYLLTVEANGVSTTSKFIKK